MVGRLREGRTVHLRQVHLAQRVQQQRQAVACDAAIDQEVCERHTTHAVHAKDALRRRIHHHRTVITRPSAHAYAQSASYTATAVRHKYPSCRMAGVWAHNTPIALRVKIPILAGYWTQTLPGLRPHRLASNAADARPR
jgi:hypothetical protein